MDIYFVTEIHWTNKLVKTRVWAWHNLTSSFQKNISGIRVVNYRLQPCNREAAITELYLQDCFALLSSYSINDPWLVSPAKHISPPGPTGTLAPSFQLTAFLLPGSQGAAEHMFHVSTASAGKRIHSPTEFPCHLETCSGQCSNLWLYKSHHPSLRKPRTSLTLLSFPNRLFFFECCTFSFQL